MYKGSVSASVRATSYIAVAVLTSISYSVFVSGLTFLISMLLLKFSHSVPTFSMFLEGFTLSSPSSPDSFAA